jgi:hypothetical protein
MATCYTVKVPTDFYHLEDHPISFHLIPVWYQVDASYKVHLQLQLSTGCFPYV